IVPVFTEKTYPANAPISIIPSMPMLTTPARSQATPLNAPSVIGVAKLRVVAINRTKNRNTSWSQICIWCSYVSDQWSVISGQFLGEGTGEAVEQASDLGS